MQHIQALRIHRVPFNTDDGRQLLLQGATNARQLGGLPVLGGVIKKGLIYRSNDLSRLTPGDVATLSKMPLRTVIDLRIRAEVKIEGHDRYDAPNALDLPMGYRGHSPSKPAEYRGTLEQNHAAIQKFFQALAKPDNYPLLYHCHDGKDRTGILTALLLLSLGTPRAAILQDYMASRPMHVKAEWLQTVFDAVDAAGGIQPFLTGCGVSPTQVQAVRQNLVG